jgi:hypothetical protein
MPIKTFQTWVVHLARIREARNYTHRIKNQIDIYLKRGISTCEKIMDIDLPLFAAVDFQCMCQRPLLTWLLQ